MKYVLITILSLISFATAAERNHPKELKVLERLIGTWDHVVTLKHPGGGRDSLQKTESRRSWSAGGAFLRIEEVNWARPEFDEFQMLLTYDVLAKTYTGVIMDGADLMKVDASWDEAKKALSIDAKGEGGSLKYTIQFLNENEAEASGTFSNSEGKVVAEVTWQQKRRVKGE